MVRDSRQTGTHTPHTHRPGDHPRSLNARLACRGHTAQGTHLRTESVPYAMYLPPRTAPSVCTSENVNPPPSPNGQPMYSTTSLCSKCLACVYWGRDETPRRKSRRAHFLIIPNYKSARSGRAHARQLDTQLPGPTHVTRPCTLPCTALTAQNCPLRRSLPATSKARTTLSSSSSVPSPPARPIAGRHRGSPSIPWPAG